MGPRKPRQCPKAELLRSQGRSDLTAEPRAVPVDSDSSAKGTCPLQRNRETAAGARGPRFQPWLPPAASAQQALVRSKEDSGDGHTVALKYLSERSCLPAWARRHGSEPACAPLQLTQESCWQRPSHLTPTLRGEDRESLCGVLGCTHESLDTTRGASRPSRSPELSSTQDRIAESQGELTNDTHPAQVRTSK